MELKLRNFETLTILHVQGEVLLPQVKLLAVGIPSVKIEGIPMLLDFEASLFKDGVLPELATLLPQLKTDMPDLFWISAVLPGAQATKLEKAMEAAQHVDRFSIKNVLEYEDRLSELEAKEKEIESKLAAFSADGSDYHELLAKIETLQGLKRVYEQSIKHDQVLNEMFMRKWKEKGIDQSELKALRKEILQFMKEQGFDL